MARKFRNKLRSDQESRFWKSDIDNRNSYILYYERLMELSIAMFNWENLPESIDERYLELALFNDGMAVFFEDEVMGYLALQCMIGGRLDVYRIPMDRRAYSPNGYNRQLNEANSVIIFNNMIRTNSALQVEVFAQRLWDYDRTIDVNIHAQKTPIFVQCEETQRLTLKNLYKNYAGNEPVIFGDKNLNPNAVKVIKTDAPYVADKIYELKNRYWNEALTYLGISNVSYQKKERMISDETIRQAGGTIASRYSRLNARRQACDQINKMFGLNIECNFREDYREADDEVMFAGETGNDEYNEMDDMVIDLRTN